jgi:hypothetical protein
MFAGMAQSFFVRRVLSDLQLLDHQGDLAAISDDATGLPEFLAQLLRSRSYAEAAIKELYWIFLGRAAEPGGLLVHSNNYLEFGRRHCLEGIASSDECWEEMGGGQAGLFLSLLWTRLSGQALLPDLDELTSQLEGGESRSGIVGRLLSRPDVANYEAKRLWTRLTGRLDDPPAEILADCGVAPRDLLVRRICLHAAYLETIEASGNGLELAGIKGVRLHGFLSDEELQHLYRTSMACVYPSYLEGFGVPLLEAMAWGMLTLTATTDATVELAAETALLVDPHDIPAISQGLSHLAGMSAPERLTQQAASRARAAEFTFDHYLSTMETAVFGAKKGAALEERRDDNLVAASGRYKWFSSYGTAT